MPTEAQARRLLPLVSDRLTALPNVVGVGVVGDGTGAVVAVYVAAKLPRSALKPEEVIPAEVSGVVDGETLRAPTRVVAVGAISL